MAVIIRKILIAMSNSEDSKYAFEWFMQYFYKDRDDVVVVYASKLDSNNKSDSCTGGSKSGAEEEEAQLLKELKDMIAAAGIKGSVVRVFASGKPGEAIVKASAEHKVDMIITGTKCHGLVKRTLMGTMSQYVVHNAQMPVLVVRHE